MERSSKVRISIYLRKILIGNTTFSIVFRSEVEKTRIETEKIKDAEKHFELENLASQKDREIQELKNFWQAANAELSVEVGFFPDFIHFIYFRVFFF